MRDIKFRAWDEQLSKMFNVEQLEFVGAYNGRFSSADEVMAYVVGPGDNGEVERRGYSNTVMQYTGLKDQNDVEIYEGDIVKVNDQDQMYEVTYCEMDACFEKRVWTSDTTSYESKLVTDTDDEFEVIGNIYENKELLK